MRPDRDLEHALRTWMRDEEPESADAVIDRVATELPTLSQRSPTWWAVQRIGALTAAAVVVVAAWIGVGTVLTGGDGLGGPPPASVPDASPQVLGDALPPLEPGTYSLDSNFPVALTFEVPAGFDSCLIDPHEQGVCALTGAGQDAGVTFVIVDNLVDDPCSAAPAPADPPIGPTVDDLVQALSSMPGFSATPVQTAVIDGRSARTFTLTAALASECPGAGFSGDTWIVSSVRTNGVGPGERNELFVVEVQGERLMIAIAYQLNTPTWAVEAMREIVATVRFGR
jgi:hypothetical protein